MELKITDPNVKEALREQILANIGEEGQKELLRAAVEALCKDNYGGRSSIVGQFTREIEALSCEYVKEIIADDEDLHRKLREVAQLATKKFLEESTDQLANAVAKTMGEAFGKAYSRY